MQVVKRFLVATAPITISAIVAMILSPTYVRGHGNEKGTATASFQGGTVAIEYMRPTLKGRDLLSQITPGSYWRLGADQATTLTTDVELRIGDGQSVAAGKYTLVLKFLGDDKWSLIIADGAARGSWEPQGLVAEVSMVTNKLDASVEALTIKLSSEENRGRLIIEWGETQMVADFTAA